MYESVNQRVLSNYVSGINSVSSNDYEKPFCAPVELSFNGNVRTVMAYFDSGNLIPLDGLIKTTLAHQLSESWGLPMKQAVTPRALTGAFDKTPHIANQLFLPRLKVFDH